MKCYYEVLDVPRDAEESSIKTAYRKLALRWHPDKNLDNPDTAKEQFQLVHQAYEVLSDRQERAWYDNHREQILRGSNKDYEDNCLDVFQYFTSSCYKGFADDADGFYSVYMKVFEQLAKEDLEHMDNKKEFCNIPMFGRSESDYESVVKPFYDYWMSYSTKRSYVWLDPYDIKETRERRVVKLIEKENKKVRAKAKKERNEEVRNLVAFVRKRDKRVQANVKMMEQKAKDNKQRAEDMAKQARRDRMAESKKEVQGEWSKFDNVQSELEVIEKQLAEDFGDQDLDEESEDEDLYCVACNKVFRTPKAFANHESSKKHRENVEKLRDEMIEEDDEFETVDEEETVDDDLLDPLDEDLEVDDVVINGNGVDVHEDDSDLEIEETSPKVKKKKNKKKKGRSILEDVSDVDQEKEKPQSLVPSPAVAEEETSKIEDVEEEQNDENSEIGSTSTTNTHTKKSKRRKDKKEKKAKGDVHQHDEAAGDIDIEHACVTCKSVFASKNKLFDHLKKTGHGVYIDKTALTKDKVKSKRNKREERRRANSISD